MSKRTKSFVQMRQNTHKRSKETPLTTAMAEMIDNEYREEAIQQEQEGGAWHDVVQTGKALPWDALLDKLRKPAVDRERIGQYGVEKSEPVPTRTGALVKKPAPKKAPEPTPSSSKKRPADATESQAAATKKTKAKSPAPEPEAPEPEPTALDGAGEGARLEEGFR
jgi:hypothetical protein